MAASRRISYEVHVQRGSRWETYARYGADGQGGALFRARCLVRHPLVEAVRVIREVYDPISEEGQVNVVFRARNEREAYGGDTEEVSRGGICMEEDPARPGSKPAMTGSPDGLQGRGPVRVFAETFATWSFARKCATGALFAALAAALLTVTTWLISSEMGLATPAFGQISGFGGFLLASVLIFVFCAIPMVLISGKRKPNGSAEQPDSLFQDPVDSSLDADIERSGFSLDADTLDTLHPDDPPPALELAETRSTLIEFMQEGMDHARAEHDLSDNFVRLGISLYLAGAAEHLAQTRELDPGTTLLVVSGCAKSLGFGTAQAESFARCYVEYLMADSRFMEMFIAGRDAMAASSAQAEGPACRLAEALGKWSQPNPQEPGANSLAILCAAAAEDHRRLAEWSNRPAMAVVREQNATLAELAQRFGGKTVGPSGTAMTIVFPGAPAALEAARAAFRHLLEQQTDESRRDVPLRIGIDVGEAAVRGHSVDGAAARLASWICEGADIGQILVSEAVFNSCAGRPGLPTFSARGRYILKGVSEPVPLYEASWRESLTQNSENSQHREAALTRETPQ